MERAATGIVRAMRRNEILAILIDRPLTEGGVAVQFFGAETRVPEGPARIALRTGARVFPVSLLPVADRVRAIVDFDVRQVHTGNMERDVQSLTQQIMISLERVIRQHPDQWYMFRRMWPAGAKAETPPAVTAES
jgi:KDO2-lipid IV(A) lauroyltransferase